MIARAELAAVDALGVGDVRVPRGEEEALAHRS
jgi:hypothetical protein